MLNGSFFINGAQWCMYNFSILNAVGFPEGSWNIFRGRVEGWELAPKAAGQAMDRELTLSRYVVGKGEEKTSCHFMLGRQTQQTAKHCLHPGIEGDRVAVAQSSNAIHISKGLLLQEGATACRKRRKKRGRGGHCRIWYAVISKLKS